MTLAPSLRIAMLGLALLGGSASAQHPPGSVEVKGMKNPDMRSFRHVTVGLDTFDEYHAMAPAVGALRFKVRAKSSNKEKSIEGITLNIVGTEATIPVPIEADGGFVIERNQQAHDDKGENARAIEKEPDHAVGSLRGDADVRPAEFVAHSPLR